MNRNYYIIAGVIVGIIVIFGVANHQAQRFWFSGARMGVEPVTFVVTDGETLTQAAHDMAAQGLVNAFWFRVYAKFSGNEEIRSGTYDIAPGNTYASILGLLHYGNVNDIKITIPEGYTIAQMGTYIVDKFPSISLEQWKTATGQFSPLESHPFIVAAEKPDDVDLEGYLFPDTYRFVRDVTAEEIIEKMIDTMEERYRSVQPMDATGVGASLMLTPHEYITLASILEREVRQPETMAMVADIFLKRLDAGMALQSDATVNYVTGGDDPSVSLNDLDIDSLYNTYKYPGLPPGPISNPGVNALNAALNPATNPYYYFLTTPDGDIHYATTHDEHVANKARYLR